MINKSLMVVIFACIGIVANGQALSAPEIKRDVHLNAVPDSQIAAKKIFVEFDSSPKATDVIREKLRSRGFEVVDSVETADVTFKFSGTFSITGGGKEAIRGKLGDVLENSISLSKPSSPDYGHQNTDLLQIAAVSAHNGYISVSDMVVWLSQKTGIAGRLNEAIAGDPRGFCWHESCNKFTSSVVLNVRSSSGHWWLQESAQDSATVLDLVISDAVDMALKPIVDHSPTSSPKDQKW